VRAEAHLVGIKIVVITKEACRFSFSRLNFEEKNLMNMAKISISEPVDFKICRDGRDPRGPKRSRLRRLLHLPRLF